MISRHTEASSNGHCVIFHMQRAHWLYAHYKHPLHQPNCSSVPLSFFPFLPPWCFFLLSAFCFWLENTLKQFDQPRELFVPNQKALFFFPCSSQGLIKTFPECEPSIPSNPFSLSPLTPQSNYSKGFVLFECYPDTHVFMCVKWSSGPTLYLLLF